MTDSTSDLRIQSIVSIRTPKELHSELPLHGESAATISAARSRIANIIHGRDKRLLVVVGPCSIHDVSAAIEYAEKLLVLKHQYADTLEIVMRVYFEKPRTIVGWKGLINDPDLDSSFQIDKGLFKARQLLVTLADMGLPAGCEFLDAATGQYYADLVSWGAIGARTTESQVHREIASGLSCPVGFKNGTQGDTGIALDAIRSAGHAHAFLSPDNNGILSLFRTMGNADAHLILRGGAAPNYDTESVALAMQQQHDVGIKQRIMIDCSHANSNKDHLQQLVVVQDIANRLPTEADVIGGVMIESHLQAGKQSPGGELEYGKSITDACIGWADTELALEALATASVV